MSRCPIESARALRRGEGLGLGVEPKDVILGLLDEVERLQGLVRPLPTIVPVAGVACSECGAGPTQDCDRALHGFHALVRRHG